MRCAVYLGRRIAGEREVLAGRVRIGGRERGFWWEFGTEGDVEKRHLRKFSNRIFLSLCVADNERDLNGYMGWPCVHLLTPMSESPITQTKKRFLIFNFKQL